MNHPADSWIASKWLKQPVEQISTGLIGKVVETCFDASGALRCRTNTGFWSPATDLRIMDSHEVQELCRNDSQIDPNILM